METFSFWCLIICGLGIVICIATTVLNIEKNEVGLRKLADVSAMVVVITFCMLMFGTFIVNYKHHPPARQTADQVEREHQALVEVFNQYRGKKPISLEKAWFIDPNRASREEELSFLAIRLGLSLEEVKQAVNCSRVIYWPSDEKSSSTITIK